MTEAHGLGALLGRQVRVAGRERHAVGLPDDRTADDLDIDIQIPNHLADHPQLLEVLPSEDRHVRLHQVEQLQDDRDDPIEVGRPTAAAEGSRQRTWLDGGLVPRRVHGGGSGEEHHVCANRRALPQIARLVPRIGAEVFPLRELQRVHEERDDEVVGPLPRQTHQGQVSLVQVPHGGDEGDGLALSAAVPCPGLHRRRLEDRLHGGQPSVGP